MIKIAIIGDIGSGKSFVSKQFLSPVFDADKEVKKIYQNDQKCFKKLKKILPKFISSFPIKKKEIGKAILENKNNLKKIINVVHPIIRIRMKKFFKKNKNKKIIVLDIPLLLENKLNKKNYILIFVSARKSKIMKNLKNRKNYNPQILKVLKKFQLPLELKRKKSNYIINNNFRKLYVKKNIKIIKNKILNK
tara:strand:- start:3730 stop:4305 length:576 start_codon:yes stop_codon:yes gene_type:complete